MTHQPTNPALFKSIYDVNPLFYPHAAEDTQFLIDMTFHLSLNNRIEHQLSDRPTPHIDLFQNTALNLFSKSYPATLELNSNLEVVGGEWRSPESG